MIRELAPTIEWITKCMTVELEAGSTFSLWRAFYDYGQALERTNSSIPRPPGDAAPTIFYVTGSLEALQKAGGPFKWMDQEIKGAYLVYSSDANQKMVRYESISQDWYLCKSTDRSLRFITICYIHPSEISKHSKDIPRITIFSTGKPELWMRALLQQKKVSGIVGWDRRIDPNWDLNWICSYDEFSINYLLNDSSPDRPDESREKVFVNTPFGLKLGLQRALREQEAAKKHRLWKETIDRAVAHILDEQWLTNPAPVFLILPTVMRRVKQYLDTIATVPVEQNNIDLVIRLIDQWCREEDMKCFTS